MRERSDIPELAAGWILAIYGAMLAFFVWVAVRSDTLGAWLILLGFFALMAAALPGLLSTRLSRDGVSQWTWRGRLAMAWSDVQRVEIQSRATLKLTGAAGTITISPVFFNDFDATLAWLSERLAAVWPSGQHDAAS